MKTYLWLSSYLRSNAGFKERYRGCGDEAETTHQRGTRGDFGVLIKAVETMDREHEHQAETRRRRAVASVLEPDEQSLSYAEDTVEKENVGANPCVDDSAREEG